LGAERSIRSYVLRQGRVSNAQARAHRDGLPIHGLAFEQAALDLDLVFGRRAPRVLEIGSGMGETTVAIARAHPERDYLAIEVHTPGVGSLLKLIAENQLTNVKVIQHDAVQVLEHMIPDGSLSGVHVFFPDPWPKKRHHKRRLIQPPLVALLAHKLAPGGYLHLATDWEEYAQQMLEVLMAEPLLEGTGPGLTSRPADRPETKFETRGLKLGHRVNDLVFRRREQRALSAAGTVAGDR
jgi:tRNA (guanine-N7-)-methyltransferase